jgi:hypothetical protein
MVKGVRQMETQMTYARGEKCATVLLTEIQVGKDTPCRVVFYQRRVRKKILTFKNAPFVTRTPLTALL